MVLKVEENPRTRLLAQARNDRLFQNGADADLVATQIRRMLESDPLGKSLCRTIVLGDGWLDGNWDEPAANDRRIPLLVLPETPANLHATLGGWLKRHLRANRNTVRFLLPRTRAGGDSNLYLDSELMLSARAATLASSWSRSEPVYESLADEFTGALRTKLADRFDRFAILSVWNYEEPAKCIFSVELHGVQGGRIPSAIQDKIRHDLFADEDFDERVRVWQEKGLALGKILAELREPAQWRKALYPLAGRG